MRLTQSYTTKVQADERLLSQPCVQAVLNSKLPEAFVEEAAGFIHRNRIAECGRVSPHCLKAFLLKKAKEHNFSKQRIVAVRNLFKSRIGYKGWFLDNGTLKHV